VSLILEIKMVLFYGRRSGNDPEGQHLYQEAFSIFE
jgi:hypothetical protein